MKNVKDQVFAALNKKFDNVTDQYPKEWALLPAVQYTEEENNVYEHTEKGETKSYVRYRVDIWNDKSTSGPALDADSALSELGLVRTTCQDAPDPSVFKHKLMRFEAIIDMENDYVYWPK